MARVTGLLGHELAKGIGSLSLGGSQGWNTGDRPSKDGEPLWRSVAESQPVGEPGGAREAGSGC